VPAISEDRILVHCCAVLTRRRLTAVRFKWTSQGIILCYFVTNSSLTHDIQSVLWIKVYFGYLTEGQNQIRGLMLQRVLHRASCRGFTPYYYDLYTLAEKANSHVGENTTALMLQAILDYRWWINQMLTVVTVTVYVVWSFHHGCRECHCFNHLYTVIRFGLSGAMRWRTRDYDFELPTIKYIMNSTNETLSFVRFLIMCDFIFVLLPLCINFMVLFCKRVRLSH